MAHIAPSPQPSINLNEHLFSTEEIKQIITPIDGHFNPENIKLIKSKIDEVKPKIVINHKINAIKYNDVFIISDIHADLRKFYSILINSKMIESPFNPYNDDIVNPKLISQAKWNMENTLLIIVGDLIDGRRRTTDVDDPDGSFELKLHILLYNLRLQAIKMNSNIIFTLGNHDCETINDNNQLGEFIHGTANIYFSKIDNNEMPPPNRRDALKPFYELSPYIFISLNTGVHQNEIVCVHAGLHTYNIDYKDINRSELEKLQLDVNVNGLDLLNNYYKKPSIYNTITDKTDIIESNPFVWTRFYAEMDEEQCNIILDKGYKDGEYKMIVVGHCPTHTNNFPNITKIMKTNDSYKHCQTNIDEEKKMAGCVVTRCHESPLDGEMGSAPRIVLVDTALSSSFRILSLDKEQINNNRPTELLHLHHNSKYSSTNRYYNNISRFLVSPDKSKQEDIIVYQTLSLAGAKHKYLKYKNKYLALRQDI
jgi:hypothetical protein